MENIVGKDIDYTKKSMSYSQPLMVKTNPIGQSGAVLQASSSSQIFEFNIQGSRCVNLSRSKLSFSVDVGAVTSAGNLWTSALGTSYLDRVTITTSGSNSVLLDINNVRNFGAMTAPIFTKGTELRDKSSPFHANSNITPVLPVSGNRALAATATDSLRCDDINAANSTLNIDGLGIDVGSNFDAHRRYYYANIVGGTADAQAANISFEFDLSALKGSICSLDKMMYFGGENLLVQVYFSRHSGFMYKTPTTDLPIVNATDVTSTVTLSNVCLYVNTENNGDVSRQLIDKVNRDGLSIPFAYPYCAKISANAPSFSTNQVISAGWGRRLQYALVSLFNSQESLNTQLDCSLSNLSLSTGYKYSSANYNVLLDSIPVQSNANLSIRGSLQNSEQWSVNKWDLKSSAIANLPDFNNRWVSISNFCGQPCAEYDSSIEAGLPLDVNRTFSFLWSGVQGSTPTTVHNVYQAFIVQRQLNISSGGVMIN